MDECNCPECCALRQHMSSVPEFNKSEDELVLWASYKGIRKVMMPTSRFDTIDHMIGYFWIASRLGLLV
jgi:hypothetical protein